MSARSVSACDCTDTYSPAAIDIAPATVPATPAARIAPWPTPPAATPTTRPATETMPSLAPSTAARNQPTRSLRCSSGRRLCWWGVRVIGAMVARRTHAGLLHAPAAPGRHGGAI